VVRISEVLENKRLKKIFAPVEISLFFLELEGHFWASELVEKKRVKRFFQKVEKFLDKFSECAILLLVEKYAPIFGRGFFFCWHRF